MMRVAQVISSLRPDGGGLPKSAASLSASLASRGVECNLIFFAAPGEMASILSAYRDFPGFDRVTLTPLTPGLLNKPKATALFRTLEEFSPDLLQTHGLWEPLLTHAHRYALRKSIPYVVMPHSMLHPWHSLRYRPAKTILKSLLGWKKRWRQAAYIQVLNEAEAEDWRREGVPNTRLIPNGIFPGEDTGPGDADGPEGWQGEFILSLARLHPQKSPDLLLRAYAELRPAHPGLKLVLAGPDYGMLTGLRGLAASLDCAEGVVFPGMLEGRDKWRALHACRCFCLPSQAEGFSMAVLEAALAGAEMVLSPECYFEELTSSGAALRSERTVADLVQKISRVLEQPGRMGAKARDVVLRNYNWDRIAEQISAAYGECLS